MSTQLRRIVEIAQMAAARVQPARFSPLFGRRPRTSLTEKEMDDLIESVSKVDATHLDIRRERFADNPYALSTDISYVHMAESEHLLMAVFVLPPGSEIPIHDHPQMYVLSKVLWGELHVQSFDPLGDSWPNLKRERVALKNESSITPAGAVRTLTPTSGNVHAFKAYQWTAVFDVAIPPYDPLAGRPCNYYTTLTVDKDEVNGFPNSTKDESDRDYRERVFLRVCFLLPFPIFLQPFQNECRF